MITYYYRDITGGTLLASANSGSGSGLAYSYDTMGRLIKVTPATLYDKNLYAYCDNNPIMRVDNKGRQSIRIDFQGKEHRNVIPHIHMYIYPLRGGRIEYTFDMNWHLID